MEVLDVLDGRIRSRGFKGDGSNPTFWLRYSHAFSDYTTCALWLDIKGTDISFEVRWDRGMHVSPYPIKVNLAAVDSLAQIDKWLDALHKVCQAYEQSIKRTRRIERGRARARKQGRKER